MMDDERCGNYVRMLLIDYSSAFNTIIPHTVTSWGGGELPRPHVGGGLRYLEFYFPFNINIIQRSQLILITNVNVIFYVKINWLTD